MYIPDNDADGHVIDVGIKNMTNAIHRLTAIIKYKSCLFSL